MWAPRGHPPPPHTHSTPHSPFPVQALARMSRYPGSFSDHQNFSGLWSLGCKGEFRGQGVHTLKMFGKLEGIWIVFQMPPLPPLALQLKCQVQCFQRKTFLKSFALCLRDSPPPMKCWARVGEGEGKGLRPCARDLALPLWILWRMGLRADLLSWSGKTTAEAPGDRGESSPAAAGDRHARDEEHSDLAGLCSQSLHIEAGSPAPRVQGWREGQNSPQHRSRALVLPLAQGRTAACLLPDQANTIS